MTDQGKEIDPHDGDEASGEASDEASSAAALRAAALRRVAAWWPKGVAKVSPEPEAISFTRRSVADWGPPNPAEASQALAFCNRYVLWLSERPEPVAFDNRVFELDLVKAYVDGPLADSPPATRKSARTYLRRLDQSRDEATITSERTEARWGDDARRASDEAIEEFISSYVPEFLDPDRFERVAKPVRDAVRAMNPLTRDRAGNALRWAAQLAAWVDDDLRPIRSDVIFHPDTVEDYLEASLVSGVEERTVASEASLLRGLSRIVNPKMRAHRHVVISRADPTEPYDADEIDSMLVLSRRQTTEVRRRFSFASIALGLCLGPHGGEYPRVRPDDIVVAGDSLRVSLRRTDDASPRVVVALRRYAHLLSDAVAAAKEAGDTYLLGGEGGPGRVSSVFESVANDTWPVPIDLGRFRVTYLVGLAGQSHTLAEFLDLSGLSTFSALDRILQFIDRPETPSDYRYPNEVVVEFPADRPCSEHPAGAIGELGEAS